MTRDLKIERTFDAPRELVWKAWSDPEMVKQWWGPKGWITPVVKMDFRTGGKYHMCMRGSMGPGLPETDNWSGGIYEEIVPLEKIVVTDSFADENGNIVPASYYGLPETFPVKATIIITFEDVGASKTKMTIYYPSVEGIEGEMLSNMTEGWNQSVEKLAEALK